MLLFQKMSRLCFNKCVQKPGTSLDSTEQVKIFENIIFQLYRYNLLINFLFGLEMCFNVHGSVYGNSELSVKVLW